MPVGITGRRADSAYARSSSWNSPASVTQQILIDSTEGLDALPELVEDQAFAQDYIGPAEIGDNRPINAELGGQFRFEQGFPVFLAAAMGSAAAPVVVSSQAAGSLVAYRHVVTMSPDLTHMFTLATDMVQYVQEVRTFKVRGFSIKTADQGRMNCSFSITADKTSYDSAININSTVAGATIATPGNRAFRKDMRVRMNLQSVGSLTTTDELTIVKELSFESMRPMAEDLVGNSDSIIEADDDGFWEGMLDIGFARMTTLSANSFARAFGVGTVFKGDIFWQGTYINSTTRRSYLFEMPALQVVEYKAVVSGHGQIRPQVKFKLRLPSAAPTGMSGITNPLQITAINAQSTNLLA